jgi:meiotically up-regulated gene 157 (Mug157) protein
MKTVRTPVHFQYCRTNLNQGYSAIDQIFRVIEEQSQASWDEDFNFISYYNWTGTPGVSLSPLVNNDGNGEPKGYTGMVGTHHRPSDDLSIFGPFFLPGVDCCDLPFPSFPDARKRDA